MRKRLLAIIATVAMVVAMVPSMAFAAGPVAKIVETNVEYDSVSAAIEAAEAGQTVKIYPGTINEDISPWNDPSDPKDVSHASEKSINIEGSEGTILTGGMYLGYDDSHTRDHTISVKGITFQGKGLYVADQKTVVIENNTFKNIASGSAIGVIDQNMGNAHGSVLIKNNTIDGVGNEEAGIRLRNIYKVEIIGNTIENVEHNGILIETNNSCGSDDADITISENTIKNWDSNNDSNNKGGRAFRISLDSNGAGNDKVVINDNKMIKETWATNPVDPNFVKLSGFNSTENIDLNDNYWNTTEEPNFDEILTIEMAAGANNSFDKDSITYSTEKEFPPASPVPDPEQTTTPAPEQEKVDGAAKPEKSPNTGDNSMAPLAVAGLVLAAMAAVVATRRRTN